MPRMNSQEWDKYYEYMEAKRESEEMDAWVAERDAEREKVLVTLTKEERALLDELKEKMNKAFKKMILLQTRDLDINAEYDKARAEYRKASEKWPVLMDGYD